VGSEASALSEAMESPRGAHVLTGRSVLHFQRDDRTLPTLLRFLLYSMSWCSLLACSPPLRGQGCIKNAMALKTFELIVMAGVICPPRF
jgi:hypothetical protein